MRREDRTAPATPSARIVGRVGSVAIHAELISTDSDSPRHLIANPCLWR
jgi:hypothetical protein